MHTLKCEVEKCPAPGAGREYLVDPRSVDCTPFPGKQTPFGRLGEAVQVHHGLTPGFPWVDPRLTPGYPRLDPRLTPGWPQIDCAWCQRLKLKYDVPISNFGFKVKLRRYSWAWAPSRRPGTGAPP